MVSKMDNTGYIEVTAAIIVQEGKILIAQRPPTDELAFMWEFPGGKVDPGETPEECLKRELFEELSIHVAVKDFICESFYAYDHKNIQLMAYLVTYLSGDFVVKEHAQIKWVLPENLKYYTFAPADIPIVKYLTTIL